MITLGVASLQLPAKYPQLPVNLIGLIGTLIWRITHAARVSDTGAGRLDYTVPGSQCTGGEEVRGNHR